MASIKSILKYHGKKPPTKEDAKMAMSHLDRTEDLNESKIQEHLKALKKAKDKGHKKSQEYNKAHIDKHEDDNDEVKQSKKTLRAIRGKLPKLEKS